MPPGPAAPNWISLAGAANARDLGGLPLRDGGSIVGHRLLRSDNLQGLTPADVALLLDEYDLRSIIDLRTKAEATSEGPTPLSDVASVLYLHASLFVEDGPVSVPDTEDGPVVLPWHNRPKGSRRWAPDVYFGYLRDRPDSVMASLRMIAHTDGATLVHCAAGKDRTGVIVALALDAVGVERDAIVDDFARTGERMTRLLARLASSPTYAGDMDLDQPDRHRPRASTMIEFLAIVDTEQGGTHAWLASEGWTDADQAALERKLTAP